MIRLGVTSLLLLTLVIAGSSAQDKKGGDKAFKTEKTEKTGKTEKQPKQPAGTTGKDGPAAPAPIPGEVDVHFINNSQVRLLIQTSTLEVGTPYGKLIIPMKDVRAIEFGIHFPEGAADKIEQAVKLLASEDFDERAGAAKTLIDAGPYSYAAALEASRAKDPEVARRAKEVVKSLQKHHPKRDLKTAVEDKVVTPTFTVMGRIATPTVKAKAEYFGQVELSLAKMRSLKAVAGLTGGDVEVSIEAAKYANAGQWMETDFQVSGAGGLLITAKGLVDTWPQQPGQYMNGPTGAGGGRFMQVNGAIVPAGGAGGRRVVGGAILPHVHGGALLGRIGENGEPFLIGDRYEANPEAEGKLYLHIGPSPWGCPSAGSFDVKISRKN